MKSTQGNRTVEVFPECVKTATGYTEVTPKDIGYGRKPSDPSGEKMEPRQIRMTDALWAKCRRLGGGAWVRDRIARAADPDDAIPPDDPPRGRPAKYSPQEMRDWRVLNGATIRETAAHFGCAVSTVQRLLDPED